MKSPITNFHIHCKVHINLYHIFLLSAFRMGSGQTQEFVCMDQQGVTVVVSAPWCMMDMRSQETLKLSDGLHKITIHCFLASLSTNLTFLLLRRKTSRVQMSCLQGGSLLSVKAPKHTPSFHKWDVLIQAIAFYGHFR